MKHGYQKKFADIAGISYAHLNQILACRALPSWPLAKRLSTLVNSTPYLWFEGSRIEKECAISEYFQENERRSISC